MKSELVVLQGDKVVLKSKLARCRNLEEELYL